MPHVSDNDFSLAIKNTAKFGDTDIFPYPIENRILFDASADAKVVLREIDTNFEASLA
ncbi:MULTISPECIES: hypothetical protein [Delftia]|uniref:hypothetical protein n=1 Tax=Delftia sp. UME58 TaxID=1862322 RepID=UPI00160320D8|nr:hypothetical protein [Delftia sp. UME58]